jgi:hypothetical protein
VWMWLNCNADSNVNSNGNKDLMRIQGHLLMKTKKVVLRKLNVGS